MNVPLDAVDQELGRLWSATPFGGAHGITANVVAFCATPDELPRARATVDHLAQSHPCRTLTIACYPGEIPTITARVSLHVNTSRGLEPVGDDIDLDVRGAARAWVPDTVPRLLSPDVPTAVWWLGDLPDDDTLYDRLVEWADVVMIHSADMDLRDLTKLYRLVEWSQGAYALADLNWNRLRSWQDFTARFFDDPASRAKLTEVHTVTVEFAPREGVYEPASTQSALFVGWLASTLGWTAAPPRWASVSPEKEAAVVDLTRPLGSMVRVRFVQDTRPGVFPGAIHRVRVESAGAAWEVARALEDPLVLCCSGAGDGLVVPDQSVRIGAPEEPKIFTRMLEHPSRDTLFERSLAAAAWLVRDVAPRLAGDRPTYDGPLGGLP